MLLLTYFFLNVAFYVSCISHFVNVTLYTVVHKKRDTFIFSITLANTDGFSQFFHYYIQQGIVE